MRRFYVFRQCRCPPCYLQNYITHPVVCQSYAVGRCGESAGRTGEHGAHGERGVHGERGAHGECVAHGRARGKTFEKVFPPQPPFKTFKLRSFFEANRRGLGSDQKLCRPLQKQGVNTSVSAEHGYEHVFLKKTLRSIDRSEIFMCRYPSHRREVITLYRDLRG